MYKPNEKISVIEEEQHLGASSPLGASKEHNQDVNYLFIKSYDNLKRSETYSRP